MSKSILYAGNSSNQAFVDTGTVVNFANVVRKYGCDVNVSGGNPVITGGYWDCFVSLTFTASGAGTVLINVFKDGVVVPFGNASVTAEANGIYSVVVPAVLRQKCNCESTVTVVISGVAGTISNAAIVLEK